MKTCSRCKESKPLDAFGLLKKDGTARRSHCKPCAIEYRKEYDATKHGQMMNRNRLLKAKYGISLAQYNRMLRKQNGGCAICGESESAQSNVRGEKFLAVDHDEETGKVRGLLCQRHNVGIGHFGHDPELLIGAAAYLIQSNETQTAIV